MIQASIAPYPRFRAFAPGTGSPLSGGRLWSLQPGTSGTGYLKATYTDASGAVRNPNPVVLDANGEADVWLSGFTKLVLEDASGVQVWSVDNVSSMPNTTPEGISEWVPKSLLFTCLSATRFSTPGDQTDVFSPGTRVEATVAAGTVYGTVQSAVAEGAPLTTTVTILPDAGGLDAGLSAVATGIVSPGPHTSFPYMAGEIRMYGGPSAPSGWLSCDGAAVSRSTYAALFAVIGTAFGAGDGSTTFNVPDFRGRSPMGAGQGATAEGGSAGTERTVGEKGGAETHTQSASELAPHAHGVSITDPGHAHTTALQYFAPSGGGSGLEVGGGSWANGVNPATTGITASAASAGGGAAQTIMGPFAVVTFIIKY